jgi:hypothetical protein
LLQCYFVEKIQGLQSLMTLAFHQWKGTEVRDRSVGNGEKIDVVLMAMALVLDLVPDDREQPGDWTEDFVENCDQKILVEQMVIDAI